MIRRVNVRSEAGGTDEPAVFCYGCGRVVPTGPGVPTCASCGPLWKLVRNALGAEVLVVDGDRVLLVRRARDPWRGCWELPGGFVERGEHPADTARREVAEELGVDVRLTRVLGFYIDAYLDELVEVVTFVGEIDDDLDPDVREVAEARWFTARDLPVADDFAASHSERLDDWLHVRAGRPSPGLRLRALGPNGHP